MHSVNYSLMQCFPSQCEMYPQRSNISDSCEAASFNNASRVACGGWVFQDDLIRSTAVEDFEMVCGNKGRKSLTQTMYMLGMLLGNTHTHTATAACFHFHHKAASCLGG